jgi:hypothetical protein
VITSQNIKLSIIQDFTDNSEFETMLPSAQDPTEPLLLFVIISDSVGGINNVTAKVLVNPISNIVSASRILNTNSRVLNEKTNRGINNTKYY